MDKVIFLGSNPSNASPMNDPFMNCKSRTVLEEWIPALELTLDQVEFMNVANYKTSNNRPLKKSEINAEIQRLAILTQRRIVITLGKTAHIALEAVCDDYCLACDAVYLMMPKTINLPHPSGRNRLLNDKAWVQQILAEAKDKLQKVRHG